MWNTAFTFQVYWPCVLAVTKLVHHQDIPSEPGLVHRGNWSGSSRVPQAGSPRDTGRVHQVPCGEPGGFFTWVHFEVPGPVHCRYTGSILLECPSQCHLRHQLFIWRFGTLALGHSRRTKPVYLQCTDLGHSKWTQVKNPPVHQQGTPEWTDGVLVVNRPGHSRWTRPVYPRDQAWFTWNSWWVYQLGKLQAHRVSTPGMWMRCSTLGTALNQSQLQGCHTSGTLQMFQSGQHKKPRGILNDTTVY